MQLDRRLNLGHPVRNAGRKARFGIFAPLFGKPIRRGDLPTSRAFFQVIEQSICAFEFKLQLLELATSRGTNNAHNFGLTEQGL